MTQQHELPTVYQTVEEERVYYVYRHAHPITKELIYIGKGSKGRAWVYAQGMLRSKQHDLYLLDLTIKGYTADSWVEIIASQLTSEEAFTLETELIWSSSPRPLFNSTFSQACILSEEKQKEIDSLRDSLLSYDKIGKQVGVSTMTVYRYLNGQTKNYVK
jgi:hypothetical protein